MSQRDSHTRLTPTTPLIPTVSDAGENDNNTAVAAFPSRRPEMHLRRYSLMNLASSRRLDRRFKKMRRWWRSARQQGEIDNQLSWVTHVNSFASGVLTLETAASAFTEEAIGEIEAIPSNSGGDDAPPQQTSSQGRPYHLQTPRVPNGLRYFLRDDFVLCPPVGYLRYDHPDQQLRQSAIPLISSQRKALPTTTARMSATTVSLRFPHSSSLTSPQDATPNHRLRSQFRTPSEFDIRVGQGSSGVSRHVRDHS